MKKLLILVAFFLAALSFAPVAVRAEEVLGPACQGAAADSAVCQQGQGVTQNPLVGANGIITRVTQIIVMVVGFAAVLMIIISGFRYITSAGDPTGVNGAKNGIIYAVVGLVVAISGQVIVTFVLSKL